MKIPFIGVEIVKQTKAIPTFNNAAQLATVDARSWFRIFESWSGAWQHNVEVNLDTVTTHPVVFACVSLIADDIAKMRMRLVQQDDDQIWNEKESAAFSPVLRQPNHFQNQIQFYQSWLFSKLLFGNTYSLKIRDRRSVVESLYVLDPNRVTPLVAPNSDVFYELKSDALSQLPTPPEGNTIVVPASEIIHDRMNTFFHPIVGLSPIYACGNAAVQGLNIQQNSTSFFGNGSRPGGVLTAPGNISQPAADRLKAYFDENFSGDNAGKVAVLGDGLKYEQMVMSATDAQLIQQQKWTGEMICTAFRVPPHMVGVGPAPNLSNVEALQRQYYMQCLQIHAVSIELCLDHGLGLTVGDVAAERFGTEFDKDDLLMMDSATLMETLDKGSNYLTPNEGRLTLNKKPVEGGDTVFRQQQDFSLEALNKRDTQENPFSTTPAPPPTPAAPVVSLPEPAPTKALLPEHAAVLAEMVRTAWTTEAV